MVDVIGRAKVIIEGDVDSQSIDAAGSKIGSSLKRGAVIGVAALGTLAVAGVKAFQAFEEAEAQSRKLSTVLGNMGESGAVEGVEKLADSLMRVTGVDDEVIKGGQTILATFSEVAESAGDVGGTFERATKASLDLAAAGFGTVESASVMLGKALQDPEKGMAALSRAGVTFTESQKQQVEGFLEVNDLASAQAIILEEVEKQVKGTAEANATESAKIAAGWGEVQEAVGGALSELTGGEVTSFSDALFAMADAIEDLAESEGWEKTGKFLRDLNKDLDDDTTFMGKWAESTRDSGQSLLDLADNFGEANGRLGDMFEGSKEIWSDWGNKIGSVIDGLIDKIVDYVKQVARIRDEPEFEDSGSGSGFFNSAPGQRAVGGPASGWTVVGERGPELVELPAGSYVNSNINSRQMVADAAGSSVTFVQNYYGPSTSGDRLQEIDWLFRYAPRYGAPSAVSA